MKSYEVQAKQTKLILIVIGISLVLAIAFIVGGSILMEENRFPVGITLVVIGCAGMLGGMLFCIIAFLKKSKYILSLRSMEFKEAINKEEGKKEFLTTDGKILSFDYTQFLYDGTSLNYSDFECYFVIQNKSKMFSNEYVLCLLLTKDTQKILIPIDKDLLKEVEAYQVFIENKEDYEFFLENVDACMKKIQFRLNTSFIPIYPLLFSKTKEEKKQFTKMNWIQGCRTALVLLIIIGINILILWLSDSKKGIQISNQIGLHWVMKGVFSLAILATIFVKAKNVKWYGRISVISFIVMYWVTLFLSYKAYCFVVCLYTIIFILIGIIVTDKKDISNKIVNRFTMLGMLLCFFAFLNINDFSFQNENIIWLLALAPAGIIMIVLIAAISIYYYFFKKKGENLVKKKVILAYISGVLGGFMLGFFLGVGMIVNLNYVFDSSAPQKLEAEIEQLRSGSQNTPDEAIVKIDDKKVRISISKEEYYSLKEGDILPLSLYQGAFHLAYYIWE